MASRLAPLRPLLPPAAARRPRAAGGAGGAGGAGRRRSAHGAGAPASLEDSVVWVVGGLGTIGRGICRGLLRAGATVIANSPDPENLRRLRERFDDVENLITVHGTFQLDKGSKWALLEKAMARPELQGRQLQHVVAHNSVRWWATETIGGATDETTKTGRVTLDDKAIPLMQMGPTFFAYHASRLPALHHAAARGLLPLLQNADGASYIFVNGGSGRNRSPMDQVNTHSIWGLAEALRQELRSSPVRVEELRVSLEFNRLQKERELDPRPSPLSHDIGDICAGIAANAKGWAQHPDHHPMANNSDILMLKAQYPTEPIYDID